MSSSSTSSVSRLVEGSTSSSGSGSLSSSSSSEQARTPIAETIRQAARHVPPSVRGPLYARLVGDGVRGAEEASSSGRVGQSDPPTVGHLAPEEPASQSDTEGAAAGRAEESATSGDEASQPEVYDEARAAMLAPRPARQFIRVLGTMVWRRSDSEVEAILDDLEVEREIRSADAFVSAANQEHLASLRARYAVPDDIEMRVPGPAEIPSRPPAGYTAFYSSFFEAGVRLPLPPLIRQLLIRSNLAIGQLNPNSYRSVSACVILWSKHFNRELPLGVVHTLYRLKTLPSQLGSYNLQGASGRFLLGNPESDKKWKHVWFFIKGPWEVPGGGPDNDDERHVPEIFCRGSWPSPNLNPSDTDRLNYLSGLAPEQRDTRWLLSAENLRNFGWLRGSSSAAPRSDEHEPVGTRGVTVASRPEQIPIGVPISQPSEPGSGARSEPISLASSDESDSDRYGQVDPFDEAIRRNPTRALRIGEMAPEQQKASDRELSKKEGKRPAGPSRLDDHLGKKKQRLLAEAVKQRTEQARKSGSGSRADRPKAPEKPKEVPPPDRPRAGGSKEDRAPRKSPPRERASRTPPRKEPAPPPPSTGSERPGVRHAVINKFTEKASQELVGASRPLSVVGGLDSILSDLTRAYTSGVMLLTKAKAEHNELAQLEKKLAELTKSAALAASNKEAAEADARAAREEAKKERDRADRAKKEAEQAKNDAESEMSKMAELTRAAEQRLKETEANHQRALEEARGQAAEEAVRQFKESDDYAAEYDRGIADCKAKLVELNPSAADLDWSFMVTELTEEDIRAAMAAEGISFSEPATPMEAAEEPAEVPTGQDDAEQLKPSEG